MPAILAAIVAAAIGVRLAIYAVFGATWGGLAEAMCHFDCGWYARIATQGYGADSEFHNLGSRPHWAFFPLYPLAMRMAAWAGLPPLGAGMLVSALCLGGFMLLGGRYLRRTRADFSMALWIGLVLAFPYTLFFSAVYSEALFALLTTAVLLCLRAGRPMAAAIVAALASATRPPGILLAVLVGADCLRRIWPVRREIGATGLIRLLLPAAIAPLGLLVFMAVQGFAVDDPFAFASVQVHWGRIWRGPVAHLTSGIAAWDWSELDQWRLLKPSRSFMALWGLAGLLVAGWLATRRRYAEAWLLAIGVLLPAASGLDSLPRFVATSPAFLFAMHDLLALLHSRLLRALVLGGLAAGHVVVLVAWMSGAGGVF